MIVRDTSESIRNGVQQADTVLDRRSRVDLLSATSRRGLLIAEGDSWFDYPGGDILDILQDTYRWDIRSVSHKGDDVEYMAYAGEQVEGLARAFEWAKINGDVPAAVLISGGGNDIAGPEFATLIENSGSVRPGLSSLIIDEIIDGRIRRAYAHLLASVTRMCERLFDQRLPILVHGYDYPVPDGRGFLSGWGALPGPWLRPTFLKKSFDDLSLDKSIMKAVIDQFNDMLITEVARPEFAHVVYVNLRGILSTDVSYKKWWANEMHPTALGFGKIAEVFASKLDELASQTPGQGLEVGGE